MSNRRDQVKSALMSPSERAALERQYGELIGPLIDAKLEAKAQELLDRQRDSLSSWFGHMFKDTTDRERLLVSREEAADMLGMSLSAVKRAEARGELPKPIKINDRVVRHRLIDVEAVARVRRIDLHLPDGD